MSTTSECGMLQVRTALLHTFAQAGKKLVNSIGIDSPIHFATCTAVRLVATHRRNQKTKNAPTLANGRHGGFRFGNVRMTMTSADFNIPR